MIVSLHRTGPAVARAAAAVLALGCLCLTLGGCSTYVERNRFLRDDLAGGDYDGALRIIDEGAKGHDRLLNLLERGLVLHYADRWEASNTVFDEAELLAADLWTRSISQAVISLVTSDEAIDFRAAPHELAMVPYYRIMNYVYLGRRESALVEARKAELQLREFADLAAAAREDGERDPVLDDHAFLHYLRAMVHEWGGETNAAFTAYRNAADAYADAAGELAVDTPPELGADLLRTGRRLGFADQLGELDKRHPGLIPFDEAPAAGTGEVVVFLELGYAPHRESAELDVPIFKNDDFDDDYDAWSIALRHRYVHGWGGRKSDIDYWLRFAMPELVDTPPAVAGARLSAGVLGDQVRTTAVEDVAGRTVRCFEADYDKIMLKTLARALAKFATKKAADKQGKVVGFLANVLGAATERADTRAWLTLPHGIVMARLSLPPGAYDLKVDLIDARGMSRGAQVIPGVTVREGDWVFLNRRVF